MAKAKTNKDEKFQNVEFDLFGALKALDKKDYDYYDSLTTEQKKKFAPYMMLMWMSTVTSTKLQKEYVLRTNKLANLHFFSEGVQKNPKLQWLMLCAASPGKGEQYHKWIPHIREKLSKLQDNVKNDEILEYYKKLYPSIDQKLLNEVVDTHEKVHAKKMFLGQQFPNLKFDEIELLEKLITDKDIEKYKEQNGE